MSVFKFKLQKVLEQRIGSRTKRAGTCQGMINRETVRIDDLKTGEPG